MGKESKKWQFYGLRINFLLYSLHITLYSIFCGARCHECHFRFHFLHLLSKLSIINCPLSIKSLQTPGDFFALRVAALQFFLMRFRNQSGHSLFRFFHSRNRRIILQRHLSARHAESYRLYSVWQYSQSVRH